MLTIPQIERLVDQRAFEQLIGRVLANGRSPAAIGAGGGPGTSGSAPRSNGPDQRGVSGPASTLLAHPDIREVVALGLALQRVEELSYGPTPATRRITSRLLHRQRSDGLFGGANRDDLNAAATAIALAGLIQAAEQQRVVSGATECGLDDHIERGLSALRDMPRHGESLTGNPIADQIVRRQLAHHERAHIVLDTIASPFPTEMLSKPRTKRTAASRSTEKSAARRRPHDEQMHFDPTTRPFTWRGQRTQKTPARSGPRDAARPDEPNATLFGRTR